MRIKKRFYLTYPKEKIQEPIIWEIGKNFDIVTNLRGASISGETGLVSLELEGEEEEIEKAIIYAKSRGVDASPIQLGIVEG
ncbi:MAG: NIL domain-containing protein [Candidatus Tectomicrobia bacterium]|uniref:NIL domain-containing protein n=1 Tax=Tectimicrobiota bacterium TaxID=2528274 RepID=A0A933GPF4_UNCTE|nr:NIL domain-containing protein [Candidatus Tectomicrobia bacterium]